MSAQITTAVAVSSIHVTTNAVFLKPGAVMGTMIVGMDLMRRNQFVVSTFDTPLPLSYSDIYSFSIYFIFSLN